MKRKSKLSKKGSARVKERFDYDTGSVDSGVSIREFLGEGASRETEPR